MPRISRDAEVIVPKDHDPAEAVKQNAFSGMPGGDEKERQLVTYFRGATTLIKSVDHARPYHGHTMNICGVYTRKDIKAIVPITLRRHRC